MPLFAYVACQRPLSSADWQLVPTPCASLGAALPVVAYQSRTPAREAAAASGAAAPAGLPCASPASCLHLCAAILMHACGATRGVRACSTLWCTRNQQFRAGLPGPMVCCAQAAEGVSPGLMGLVFGYEASRSNREILASPPGHCPPCRPSCGHRTTRQPCTGTAHPRQPPAHCACCRSSAGSTPHSSSYQLLGTARGPLSL